MVQLLWKTVWQFLKLLNGELPYDPAILLLGRHPTEMKTYVHANIYSQKVETTQTSHQLTDG